MGGALDLDRAPVPGVRLKLVGRFGPCYLNQLATATNAENAGPDEPSHYGAVRWLCVKPMWKAVRS